MGVLRRRLLWRGVTVSVVVVGAACGSSDEPDAATETFVKDAVELDALPAAEGRTAFSVSEDVVIVGGGAVRSERGAYEPILDLWSVGAEGEAETLPALPAEGVVQGLSGIQVGGVLVVAGMECAPAASEFLTCPLPRRPLIWMKDELADGWSTVEVPERFVEGVLPDIPTGGTDLYIVGRHGDAVVLAFFGSEVTRYLSLDTASSEVALRGDGPPTSRGWSTTWSCVTDQGDVLQAARHDVGEGTDREGAEDVSLMRLDAEGRWTEGPRRRVGDIAQSRNVRLWDLVCSAGQPPTMLVSVDGLMQMDDEWAPSILTAGGSDGLTLVPGTDRYGDLAAAGVRGAINLTPFSDGAGVVVTGSEEIFVAALGRATALKTESTDRIAEWNNSLSVFAFGDLIGTIDHRTGEIHVD